MFRICSRFPSYLWTANYSRCIRNFVTSNPSTSNPNWQEFRERYQSSWNSRNRRDHRNDEKKSNSNRQSKSSRNARIFFLPAGFWGTIKYNLGFVSEKFPDEEIKEKIKAASIYCQEQKYEDALVALHEALFKAEHDKNESAVNYCLDMMANINYYIGRLDEAEKIFSALIQRILAEGKKADGIDPATSPAIVELSLKLADIYAIKGEDDKAESGFEFCITTQKANLDRSIAEYKNKVVTLKGVLRHDRYVNPESTDPYALYGLVLETYARYLVRKGRIDESQAYINRALEMSLEIFGASHQQTISIMNNFAMMCMIHNRFDIAEKYLKQVVNRAPFMEQGLDNMAGYYTNYAESLWHLGRHEESLDYARRAAKLATDKDTGDEARKRTEEYVKRLENEWKKESKKNR